MSCSKSDITKNSRWREKSAGNDRVKLEAVVGNEIVFRDTDSGSYGTKGRMNKRDFLDKFECTSGDPENIKQYSEWKEKDAYRDEVQIVRVSGDKVLFVDKNKGDYGTETEMSMSDFLEKFELITS